MGASELLRINGLHVMFKSGKDVIHAAKKVDFGIRHGTCCGLVGETGCGKSVLGQAILGLLPRNASATGEIYFEGKNLMKASERERRMLRRQKIALIAQNPSEALDPLMTNGNQLLESILLHGSKNSISAKETAMALLRSLHFVNPEFCMRSYPHQLSGGMKQRVLAAMGMSGTPKLLIADEPTKGLDVLVRGQVVDTLRTFINATGTASLIITHDLPLAQMLCENTSVMYAGEIVETGTTEDVFAKPQHPYAKALIASQPRYGLWPIPGESPGLSALPGGCRFFSRCEHAAICAKGKSEHPPLGGAVHQVRCFLR
jgi:peptide/nickel transport system ATP-binding protein